ncbi:MAG TPA: TMEM175 family protein [Anaerolineales bacterium]|nr:TMEM175 family protein [Anaerolineales bacterium]
MSKGRMEAFSDGVIAIIITIMVLELRPPEEGTLAALLPLLPKFLSYILSFVFIGIYWNNHHHLLQAAKGVNGSILWANMHLLFWMSTIPFTTSWMGEHFASTPVAIYGAVLWITGLAYYILSRALIAHHGADSVIAKAIGRDEKGLRSLFLYTAAIVLAFVSPWVSAGLYIVVAIIWFIPDRRIEEKVSNSKHD